MHRKSVLTGLNSACLMVLAGAAQGQETSSNVIEEVIVTAEKRSESINDLPIAISAFDGQSLERVGVTHLRDLQYVAPSVNIGAKGSETFVSIRGIGSEVASIGSEPGVTISQDGVSLARHLFFNPALMDVERVEVLRGPQGTFSGRNSTGGAINIYSNRPTETMEIAARVSAGNRNRFGVEGILSGPLVGDRLLGRLALAHHEADGWLETQDQRLAAEDNTHARGSISWQPVDAIETLLFVDWFREDALQQGTGNIGRANPDLPSLGEVFGVPDVDVGGRRLVENQQREFDKEQVGVTGRIAWDVGPSMTLTSVTGYWSLDIKDAQDTDGTLVSVGDFPVWNWDLEQFSQELTLTTDLGSRADLVIGGQYLNEQADQPLEYVATVLGIGPGEYLSHPHQELESIAGYAQVRVNLTDKLRLSVGARYTRDEKRYEETAVIALYGGTVSGDAKDSWDAFTPRVAIDYSPDDRITLFANVSRGFKSGGFNTLSLGADEFEPEYVWNYEAGVKHVSRDGARRLAATAFYMDYSDLQQTLYSTGPFGVPVADIVNVDSANIAGVELEGELRLLSRLILTGSITWLTTEIGDHVTINPVDPPVPPPVPENFRGNDLARSPEWQVNVSAEYTAPLSGSWELQLQVHYSWRDHQFFDVFNNPLIAQDDYGLLNAYLGVLSTRGLQLELFGSNLTDESYLSNGFSSVILPGVPMNIASIGAPRSYGVRLSYAL